MYHSFLIHSSADGHLGCFHVLAIINSAVFAQILKLTFSETKLLGIYPEETKTERGTCIPLFIAALFTIARTWKQPRCPLIDEWIKKLWYTYTMEYYSAIKRNTFESVQMRWMNLELIIQSEVSQKEKHQCSILTHIYGI